tara:strand:+ start:462669 stop:463130 length:462 start_codon:yes stop_codon:yes gene_type:complete
MCCASFGVATLLYAAPVAGGASAAGDASLLDLTVHRAALAWAAAPSGDDYQYYSRVLYAITYAAFTLAGAAFAEIFSARQNPHSSMAFWRGFFAGRKETFYRRMDFLTKCVAGTIVAAVMIGPVGITASFVAGVGWAAAFHGLLKHTEEPEPL